MKHLSIQLALQLFALASFGRAVFAADSNATNPVMVELYYESYCPYCMNFIKEHYYPTYQTLENTGILDVAMYPYGNAHETEQADGTWQFTCQHGPKECEGNILEACVMKYAQYKDEDYFSVIHCMEASDDPVGAAKECVDKQPKLQWQQIDTCAKGKEGNDLHHQMAVKTGQLNPPHQYVPWILVNGVHTDEIQNEAQSDLLGLVCSSYPGTKPSQCNGTP